MSFDRLYRVFHRKNEHVYLLKKQNKLDDESHVVLDEFGFAQKEYASPKSNSDMSEIGEIKCIIQKPQKIDINEKGVESNPIYSAYCEPTIHIKQNELNEYRISYVKPYETLIMKIIEYNPNLFVGTKNGSKQHHIEMKLLLDKKI